MPDESTTCTTYRLDIALVRRPRSTRRCRSTPTGLRKPPSAWPWPTFGAGAGREVVVGPAGAHRQAIGRAEAAAGHIGRGGHAVGVAVDHVRARGQAAADAVRDRRPGRSARARSAPARCRHPGTARAVRSGCWWCRCSPAPRSATRPGTPTAPRHAAGGIVPVPDCTSTVCVDRRTAGRSADVEAAARSRRRVGVAVAAVAVGAARDLDAIDAVDDDGLGAHRVGVDIDQAEVDLPGRARGDHRRQRRRQSGWRRRPGRSRYATGCRWWR